MGCWAIRAEGCGGGTFLRRAFGLIWPSVMCRL